jgi:hypothetical protein
MEDQLRLAQWSIRLTSGHPPVVYHGVTGEDIATVLGASDVALERAILIAKAPSLRDAVRSAVTVFAAMKEYGDERERAVGGDMLPSMKAALEGLGESPVDAPAD